MTPALVTVDGKTHERHPRWQRLAICGQVLFERGPGLRGDKLSCALCARGLRPVDARRARLEETVRCRLRCACGMHHERELPADEPLRQVLSGLACSSCGEPGLMALAPRKTP